MGCGLREIPAVSIRCPLPHVRQDPGVPGGVKGLCYNPDFLEVEDHLES